MALRCAGCGKLSRDELVCEHCRHDLGTPPAELPPPYCPAPPSGVRLTLNQTRLLAGAENYLHVETLAGAWRVHWLGPTAWSLYRGTLEQRLRLHLPCLPPGRVIEDAEGAWILFEAGLPLAVPWANGGADPLRELRRLLDFLDGLEKTLDVLHAQGLVWLNFDPLELELKASADPEREYLRVTNLDLRVFRRGELDPLARLRPHFVAPEIVRGAADEIGPATDVFHLALFGFYWLAGLLPDGFPGHGLEAFGYQIPPLRIYAPWAPPGLHRALAQALSLLPAQRFGRPAQLLLALEEVVTRFERRLRYQGNVAWEIGAHTRVGRTKAALERDNEDQVLVRLFAGRALLAVADGISTCDVGSGRLASWLTIQTLARAFGPDADAAGFGAAVADAARRSAASLLEWALEKGYEQQLRDGADLMGTTLTVAWLEGRELRLANLGDSRAYLIDEHDVEQLTVDGDLGSSLLGQGYPPETLIEIGGMARALRECIGGCQLDDSGKPAILEDLCRPRFYSLPLLPGDILVLCTDGLVEEGMFLEPETLGHLVRTHRDRPAQQIAELLADSADTLQRLPSPMEPDGFGDNISVIVVKIS